MEKLTKRQERILNVLVQDYIERAEPVSSKLLCKKGKFDLSSATIRNELQHLTDKGFIFQPHTSAGRVPTSKGYRFFVDKLMANHESVLSRIPTGVLNGMKGGPDDDLKFFESFTKAVAVLSSSLVFTYLDDKDILWKDGWKEVFQNPEFKEPDILEDFLGAVEGLENNIKSFMNEFTGSENVQVYIGKEEPVLKSKEFSLIISKTQFPDKENGVLAILGPKRMEYGKNIGLMQSLIKSLEELK
jgi:heat-inducible transcriptional repressor